MEENELEFFKNYKKSLLTDSNETASQRAGIQRKCLAQLFNYSLENFDANTTNYLLEKNLLNYSETVDDDATKSTFMCNDRVKTILEKANVRAPVALNSNLADVDLRALLQPPPCFTTQDFQCTRSEKVGEADFAEFMEAFRKGKPPAVPVKERKLAKSFAPQTCSKKPAGEELPKKPTGFITAGEELQVQNSKHGQKRKLGLRRNVNSKFIPPLLCKTDSSEEASKSEEWSDERLKNIDPKMVELIKSDIMDVGAAVQWSDIAGLDFAKTAIQEAVVWPMLRPDIFKGLRRPPKGILLFGPPGTGKTLIGKCVASQSKSTFFSISASSLTSKWVGDGEKMVRALFAVARCYQPAVIFIDEIDSLLSQRNESEHESSRRIKTEFLVQLDGATTDSEERLLVIGATNRPQELDEAARRRFVKRLYIPLPDMGARRQLVQSLVGKERHQLEPADFEEIAKLAEGYSGADIRNLCSEASLGPIRSLDMSLIERIKEEEVPPVKMGDFREAFARVRSSVAAKDLEQYVVWDNTYGSGL